MLVPILGLALVSMLALVVLPVPRVRQFLLTAATRFGQTGLLALLAACGTFLVTPDAAPAWTKPLLAPVVQMTESAFGAPAPAGLPWLTLAVFVVAAVLPVLIALELAIGVTRQTRVVNELRADLRTATEWVDTRLFALGLSRTPMPQATESAAAAEAFRDKGKKSGDNGPLVIDLMNK